LSRGTVLVLATRDFAPIGRIESPTDPETEAQANCFGSSMTFLPDIDGDGVDDIALGDWVGDSVHVLSGAKLSLLYALKGETVWDWFGWALAPLDDLDGDGVGDLAVAARAGLDPVALHSGRDGKRLLRIAEHQRQDGLGTALAAVADLDGDGQAELALGAPGYEAQVSFYCFPLTPRGRREAALKHGDLHGSVLLVSPRTGATLQTLRCAREDEWLGASVAAIGDFDGDGSDDFAVGAAREASVSAAVYSGQGAALLLEIRRDDAR
jgi:hypothetical protein